MNVKVDKLCKKVCKQHHPCTSSTPHCNLFCYPGQTQQKLYTIQH